MSNRLEQEFPEVAWRAMPPVGPGGVPAEAMRECLERGRQLRNQAMRNGLRTGGTAVIRGIGVLMALIRCPVHALVRRRHEPGCWAGSAHGA